uniref:Putative intron-encoded protein n=1 Tax=Chaetosphaeridium globosum TaxID=96477 RepID=Q8M1D4_CHAGL|nr:putative intron-encoded protein [Chaetosphaeridium globosum]AAM96640.1 putative intron-encoded protein [Chaetosphaeridium globosum]
MRQSACEYLKNMSYQRLNVEPSFNFHEWLVGFTDGSGCFSITQQSQNLQCTFKITQSVYNYRVLYYIKKNIGYGSITQDGFKRVQYCIRDTKILKQIILPIFEIYPLHTSKHIVYVLWKQALLYPELRSVVQSRILSASYLTCLDNLFEVKPIEVTKQSDSDVRRAILSKSLSQKRLEPTKSWIVGFVEADGSFFLTKKGSEGDIVHTFCITQKHDYALLEQLKKRFHIKAKIKHNQKTKAYVLETTNTRNIRFLIQFFHGTFKGMKSLEYRIWARSFVKNKGLSDELLTVQNQLRKLKKVKV